VPPSANVAPLKRETKFHTRAKQQAKLQFCKFLSFYSWIVNGQSKGSGPRRSRRTANVVCSKSITHAATLSHTLHSPSITMSASNP